MSRLPLATVVGDLEIAPFKLSRLSAHFLLEADRSEIPGTHITNVIFQNVEEMVQIYTNHIVGLMNSEASSEIEYHACCAATLHWSMTQRRSMINLFRTLFPDNVTEEWYKMATGKESCILRPKKMERDFLERILGTGENKFGVYSSKAMQPLLDNELISLATSQKVALFLSLTEGPFITGLYFPTSLQDYMFHAAKISHNLQLLMSIQCNFLWAREGIRNHGVSCWYTLVAYYSPKWKVVSDVEKLVLPSQKNPHSKICVGLDLIDNFAKTSNIPRAHTRFFHFTLQKYFGPVTSLTKLHEQAKTINYILMTILHPILKVVMRNDKSTVSIEALLLGQIALDLQEFKKGLGIATVTDVLI